jgi:signal transduction histidine kinase
MFTYDVINTLLAIILLFNTALLLPILRNVKNNIQTFVYAVNIVTILLWVITMMGYRSEGVHFETWLRALYVVAIFIGVTYMQFTFYYPTRLKYGHYYIYIANTIAFITAYLVTLTDKIIVKGLVTSSGTEPYIVFGSWYLLYVCTILLPFVAGFLRHTYLLFKHNGKVGYLLSGYFISANVAFITNLILPWMGIFILNWVGQFFTVIMVSFTTYSILKFNVMNIKFFAVNVGVTFLLITTFSQILFADSLRNLLVSGLVFFVSLITGGHLIVLSNKERKSLENTITLNGQLETANQQLKSLDKLKSEFISLASHQLRSPLTVIKGYASTLTDGAVGDLTPKQKEIVQHIYSSAQGLASVVEDFLDVSKIEQGGLKYNFSEIDLRRLVKELSRDMKMNAKAKKLEFTSIIHASTKHLVYADEVKLRQVFLNLIDNSIKYTKEGFVHVILSYDRYENSYIFSVSDSGIGISKETKAKLFTKFGRGEGGMMNAGGSGLGLYLAQEIIKEHKGKITVSSEGAGKGSTFSVVLPCV